MLFFSEPSLPASEVADEPPTLTKEEPVPLETQVRRHLGFPVSKKTVMTVDVDWICSIECAM